MTPLANGRIEIWQGSSLWIMDAHPPPGSPQRTDFHSHHALQLTLALEGRFDLHLDDLSMPGPALLVAPDVRHSFEPKGLIALLFIEPESLAGRALANDLLAGMPIASIPSGLLTCHTARIAAAFRNPNETSEGLREISSDIVRTLWSGVSPPAVDARVQMTLDWVADRLDSRVSMSEAAAYIGLSVDRMSHLFVEQTGLPFRTYLLWLRLGMALERYAAGASLTEAAHEAGFADSAHFSRTFRRMFGVAAAELRLA